MNGTASMTPDVSAALLRTISEVLDIRSVFPRVSEIVKHVLPHDALELVFHDREDMPDARVLMTRLSTS